MTRELAINLVLVTLKWYVAWSTRFPISDRCSLRPLFRGWMSADGSLSVEWWRHCASLVGRGGEHSNWTAPTLSQKRQWNYGIGHSTVTGMSHHCDWRFLNGYSVRNLVPSHTPSLLCMPAFCVWGPLLYACLWCLRSFAVCLPLVFESLYCIPAFHIWGPLLYACL